MCVNDEWSRADIPYAITSVLGAGVSFFGIHLLVWPIEVSAELMEFLPGLVVAFVGLWIFTESIKEDMEREIRELEKEIERLKEDEYAV